MTFRSSGFNYTPCDMGKRLGGGVSRFYIEPVRCLSLIRASERIKREMEEYRERYTGLRGKPDIIGL